MSNPGQDYDPTGASFPAWPLNLPLDGEPVDFDRLMKSTDPKKGLFGKLMDASEALRAAVLDGSTGLAARLARQTAPTGESLVGGAAYIDPATPSQGTLAAGTVEARIRALFAGKAGFAAAINAFAGKMKIGASAPDPGATGLGVQGTVVATGGLSTPGPLTMQAGSHVARFSQHITTTATTATIDVTTAPLWIADAWHGAGATLTATLADYGGSDEPEVEILFLPTGASDQIAMQRNGGSPIVTIIKAALARWRWDQSPTSGSPRWRYMGPGALTNDPANVTISVLSL